MEGISTHIASTYKKNPKIAWIHTDVSTNPWADSSYRSITQQERIYNSYDKIVFVSEGGKNGFMSKFPQVNTDKTIIHNVIDSRKIQNKS